MSDPEAASDDDSPIRPLAPISNGDAVALLREGELAVLGRMPWSSNATFLVDVDGPDRCVQAVYKPERGERPLWDFPSGLYAREAAAYELGTALGWSLVPPTVIRDDGPLGVGSLQLCIPADYGEQYFSLLERPEHHDDLRRLCAFDIVANSTDRKAGHCLLGHDGKLWAIDNGLSFHAEFKLRTVIWDFGGEPLPHSIRESLERRLDNPLPTLVEAVLDPFERDALRTRTRALLHADEFPVDPTGRRYPWPLV